MKQVVVVIKPDGSTEIDAQNFKGAGCSLATRELELALAGPGGTVQDKKKPGDFFATNPQGQKVGG